MKLGQRVKCSGYVKKNGNRIEVSDDYCQIKKISKFGKEEVIEYDETVVVNEIINKEFEGYICGAKSIHSKIFVEYCCPIDVGVGTMPESVRFRKCDFIDCYEICLVNKNKTWGKRLVPIDNIKISKEVI